MGGNNSKPKKFSAQDRFRRRWHYEGDTPNITSTTYGVPITETGDMGTPVYIAQGEPDEYINICESDHIENDSVWQPQNSNSYMDLSSRETCVYGELYEETSEIVIRETVFDGPDDIYEDPDIYDADDDGGDSASETQVKQLANVDDTTHAKQFLESDTSDRQHRSLHRYEEMVIIFEPLIVRNVIARHLIPHLTFLEDRGKVQAIADRSPRSAVLYIIDELKNNHTETGRWKQFIEALERCEYKYIVSILRGEKPVDHSYQREYLRIITPALRTNISPIELTEVLWSADVISEEDKEEIQQMHNNFGPLAATDRLLDRVPTKHKYWYSHLIDGLRRINMEHAADMLDIPELRKLSDYTDDADAYMEPLKVHPAESVTSTDSYLRPSESKCDDTQTFLKKYRPDDETNGIISDTEIYEEPGEFIPYVPKRRPSVPRNKENDRYVRKMPAMSVNRNQNGGYVKRVTESMVYNEDLTTDDCALYSLPPPPSLTQFSSRTHTDEDNATPDNTRCKTITYVHISTQQDGQVGTPLQSNTNCTRPHSSRYINTSIEADTETRPQPPIPKRPDRQLSSPTTRKELPLPPAYTSKCEEQNDDCTNNLNTRIPSQPQTLPKYPAKENFLRTISMDEEREEEYSDVEVVVLEYPPRITNSSPPFPEPNGNIPDQTRSTRLPPSKPFCKQPIPLPRKTLSTNIHKAMEASRNSLSDTYYDDAYTEVDDKPSPVIDDGDEYEEDTDECERKKSNEKKPVGRHRVMFEASKEHEIANRRPRGNKLGISKPPSQKKKMRRKRLAKSRKKTGGNIFRNLFHRKKIDKQSSADEEDATSNDGKCAVQLNRNNLGKSRRSKSLPTEFKNAFESMDLYYSQPFRDERRKPEVTGSITTGIVPKPANRDPNAATKVKETLHNNDKNKELMDIFITCRKRHGIDQEGINSDIIVPELTLEEIHPEVEALLKDVKQQQDELTVLVLQEPVHKMKLEIQTSINEKLKHKRVLERQFEMKAKEASALKEAHPNTFYQSNSETNSPTYDTRVSSAREMCVEESITKKPDCTFTNKADESAKDKSNRLCTDDRDSIITKKPDSMFTEEREGILPEKHEGILPEKHDVSAVIEIDTHNLNKADDNIYDKDSAFYSYSVRL